MKPRFLIAFCLAGILLGATAVLGATFIWSQRDKVIPGVQIQGLPLQGLRKEDGVVEIKKLEKRILAVPAVLKHGEKTWELPLEEIDLHLDAEAMMDVALRLGKEGPFFRQWQQRRQIRQQGYELPLMVNLNQKKFTQKITELTAELGFPPEDASFKITEDDRVEVVPGRDGLQVDAELAYQQLLNSLGKGQVKPIIHLSLVQVKPRRITEAVTAMGLKGLLSAYSTSFDPTNVGRTYNIRVAAAALDGLLVPPGQEISFNQVVGPRSTDAGYKNAQVIINNEFVEGIGGGVCQVSSTLYNAILLANLEILERTNHSLPVAYVPMGRDATVVYGAIDLKFRNNTESYIYIRSSVKGRQLTFKIYGNTDYKAPVTIRTRIIKEIEPETIYQKDPYLKKGEQVVKQEGSKGYQVVAERVVWENNQAQVEALPPSLYEPVDRIVALGTKEEKEVPVFLPPGVSEEQPPVIPPVPDKENKKQTQENDKQAPEKKESPGSGA